MFAPQIINTPDIRLSVPVGLLQDIPTGIWLEGMKGEKLLCGGMSAFEGQTGGGNTFKSTITYHRILSSYNRLTITGRPSSISVNDTEQNVQKSAMLRWLDKFPALKARDILINGELQITDKTMMAGDDNWNKQREFIVEKVKNAKKYEVETPFKDLSGKPFKTIPITFHFLDSISKWETQAYNDAYRGKNIGASERTIANMTRANHVSTLLEEISVYAPKGMHFTTVTAHIGIPPDVKSGGPPGANLPQKKLPTMKAGQVLKGGSDNMYYLPLNLWDNVKAAPCLDDTGKALYRRNENEHGSRDVVDLFEVTTKLLRGKGGTDGMSIEVIVSKNNGVEEELTLLHFIRKQPFLKTSGSFYYGTTGSYGQFQLVLRPGVTLSRNTGYEKLKEDYRTFRALELTCDLIQLQIYGKLTHLTMSPEELYAKVKERGYDWEVLLDSRGWWTYDNYHKDLKPYLSIMDLLEVAHGKKDIFWYKK